MKVLAILLTGTVAFAVDYVKLDRELAKQKQESILRDLRIERKTGMLREMSVDIQLKSARMAREAFLVETYKGWVSAKSLPIKSSGYVGKVLLTEGIALYTGMETPYGKVNVEKMKIGSFWINVGIFERVQPPQQVMQLSAGPSLQAGAFSVPPPPPPPPPPPELPRQQSAPQPQPLQQQQPQQPTTQPQQPPAMLQNQPPQMQLQPPAR